MFKSYVTNNNIRTIRVIETDNYLITLIDRTKDSSVIDKFEVDIDLKHVPRDQQFVGNGWSNTSLRDALRMAIECVRKDEIRRMKR